MNTRYRTTDIGREDLRQTERENEIASATAGQGRTFCVMAMPAAGISPAQTEHSRPADCVKVRHPAPARSRTAVRRHGGAMRLLAGLLMSAVMITSPVWLTGEKLLPVMRQLSASSASIQLPETGTASPGTAVGQVIAPSVTTISPTTHTTTATSAATTAPENTEGLLPVKEQELGGSGTRVGDIWVKNSTGYDPDFADLLNSRADCRIKLNAGYQVLIVHTHTTEGYAQRDDGLYSPDYSPRTTDLTQSVAAVGEVLAQKLEAAGIRTLHATEVHDHPQYNGSYDRALDTISKYLKQYPSIEMVLDVHRDAITYDDGTKLKPTVNVNGRKAAQVMMISGCDAGGKLYFPGWKNNLCMALNIQQAAQESHPGLMRPLSFAPYRYNMHMTPNSLLLEFGTDANTLDEALYSAEMMGEILAGVLLEYDVERKG